MVLAASSLIAACSGGGGGSSTPAPVSNSSISGTVALGSSAGSAAVRKQAGAIAVEGAKITIKSYDTAGVLRQTVETVSTSTGDFVAQIAPLAGGGWVSVKVEKDNAIAFEKTFPYKTASDLTAGLKVQAQLDPVIAKVINTSSNIGFDTAAAGDMVSIAVVEDSKGARKIVSTNEIKAAKAAGGTITWQLDVAKQVLAAAGTTSLTVKAQNYDPSNADDMTRFPADNTDTGERLVSTAFDFIDIKDQDGKALSIPKATAKAIRKAAAIDVYRVKKQIPNCSLIVKDEDTAKAGVQVGFYFMRSGKWTKLGMATLYKNSTPDDTQLFQLSDVAACAGLPYAVLTDADISKDIDFDLKWFNFDYVAFGDIKTACIAGDIKLKKTDAAGAELLENLGGVSVYLQKLEQPAGTDVAGFRSSYGYAKTDGTYQIDFTYSSVTLASPKATISYTDPVTFQYTTITPTLSAKNLDGCYVVDTVKVTAPECTVTGKVLKSDGTAAQSRAVSTYQAGSYSGSRWDYTDSSGSYSIPAICSVDYKLSVDGITKDFNVNSAVGTDEKTDAAKAVAMKDIQKVNKAPSAYIYADNSSVAVNNGVNLSGYGYDPDGDSVTYAWSNNCGGTFFDSAAQTAGTATSSKQSNRWKAPAAAPANNICTITLSVSDGSLSDTKTTDIYVSATGNRPPVITYLYAPRAAKVNSSADLSVYAYDANGDSLTYSWSADCGTLAAGVNPYQQKWTAPATAPAAGSCNVSVAVSDGIDTATKSASIAIAANKQPIIYNMLVPTTAAFGKSRIFSAYAYDPDYDQISYNWSASCGSLTNQSTSTPTWLAPATENTACNITLTVSDGITPVTQTKTVTTTANNAPVISSATGPTTAQVSSSARFTGTATDADGDNLSWSWTIKTGGGTLVGTCSGSGTSAVTGACTYSTPAVDETATLTFSVGDGQVTVTRDVSVNVTSITGGFGVTVR